MSEINTKKEFFDAAMRELTQNAEQYPELVARVRTGDSTITQIIGAFSQQLAMLSFQVGIAETEVWQKTRENIILADASSRGIIPLGVPTVYNANFHNTTGAAITISAGRRLIDGRGRVWRVKASTEIPNNQIKKIAIEQVDAVSFRHEVSEEKNFYEIPVKSGIENGSYLSAIRVLSITTKKMFKENYKYNNIELDEHSFQINVDELNNLSIQFGVAGVAGYVPVSGEIFSIHVDYTGGDVELSNGAILSFEYVGANDAGVSIKAAELVKKGSSPKSIDELRELARYPSLYDANSVYLGEFEYLINRNISGLNFLSVWNEQKEESVRGANVNNINCLFVSFSHPKANRSAIEKEIRRVIEIADNSYKVKFVNPIERKIPMTVNLVVPDIYDEAKIKSKVVEYIVGRYGRNTSFAKNGGDRINWQDTVSGLRSYIYELSDSFSDISVAVNDSNLSNPEIFKFVDSTTLTINYQVISGNG